MRTSTDMTPRPRSGMRTAAAQTAFDSGGLHYHWDPFSSGLAFPGMPVGLGFVDPTPIATHVVSADALEGKQELNVCLFVSCFTSQVNSYGHGGTVSSPSHTFSWAGLNKRLTSNLCTNFRL